MMKRPRFDVKKEVRGRYGPAFRIAVVSLVLCGLVFPLVITGFATVLFPSQANGSLVYVNGKPVGSKLIAQTFNVPIFFQPRDTNSAVSASGVDPDITIQDAYGQIPRISSAANIPIATLRQIVDQNVEGVWWVFGTPYVNVLKLNMILIQGGYSPVYSVYLK